MLFYSRRVNSWLGLGFSKWKLAQHVMGLFIKSPKVYIRIIPTPLVSLVSYCLDVMWSLASILSDEPQLYLVMYPKRSKENISSINGVFLQVRKPFPFYSSTGTEIGILSDLNLRVLYNLSFFLWDIVDLKLWGEGNGYMPLMEVIIIFRTIPKLL